MLCDRCKKNPASVHMQQIVNGMKTETNLCHECAYGEEHIGLDNFFQGLLGSLLASNMAQESHVLPVDHSINEPTCAHCSTTYREFRDKGRLGCVHCYEAFSAQLAQIFGSIQTHGEHRGKIPLRSGARLNLARRLKQLRQQQQGYVDTEEYEKAAAIRDEIRRLEMGG